MFIGATTGRGTGKLASSIAEELGDSVSIIELLTGSLAGEGMPGATYLDYMEYNAGQILRGISGD